MAMQDNIYRICSRCLGTGIEPLTSPEPPGTLCQKCLGKKGIKWGWIKKEIIDE